MRAVAGAVGSLGLRLPLPDGLAAPSVQAHRPAPAHESRAPALVLEAEEGQRAAGAFVVENLLDHSLSAPVVASAFTSADGHGIHPKLGFDPEVVVLAAGELVTVGVVAAIDGELELGTDYRGQVTVPGLPANGLEIVIRRLAPQGAGGPAPARRRSAPSARRKGGDGPRRTR